MAYNPDNRPKLPDNMTWLGSRELKSSVASSISREFELEIELANSISEKIVNKLVDIGILLQRHPDKMLEVLNSISTDKSIEDYYHGMFTKLAQSAQGPQLSGLAKVANRALELKKYEKGYKLLLVDNFRAECASIRRNLSLGVEDSQNKLSEVVSFATNKAMERFKTMIEVAIEQPSHHASLKAR